MISPRQWSRRRKPLSPTNDQLSTNENSSARTQESISEALAAQWVKKQPEDNCTKKGSIVSFCLHHPSSQSALLSAKKELPGPNSPCWEKENGMSDQLPQPFKRPTSPSPHPESSIAETSRNGQEQGRKRLPVLAMWWEWVCFLVVCSAEDLNSPWRCCGLLHLSSLNTVSLTPTTCSTEDPSRFCHLGNQQPYRFCICRHQLPDYLPSPLSLPPATLPQGAQAS